MAISQLKKLRAAGKLEDMAAVAHALDLYTTAGFSVDYKASQAIPIANMELLIYHALSQVIRELPTLFAVPIVTEGAETYFARLSSIDLRKVTSFAQRQKPIPNRDTGRDGELDDLLQQQVNTNFKSDQGILPVWRLVILYDFGEKKQFTANFMVHHAIADGASFQILHQAFQKALHKLSSSPSALESEFECIIAARDEDGIGLPLESMHSLPVLDEPTQGNGPKYNDWLGNPTEVPNKTGYKTLTLSPPMVQAFAQECGKNKVPIPAGLNALITRTVYSHLPSATESMDVNIPVDIRADLPPKDVNGVMGNFFDAFRTRVFRSDFCGQDSSELGEIWTAARKVQSDTRKYFSRAAPSGETYLNIAALKNVPDLRALLKSMIGGPRSESLELAYIGPHVPYSEAHLGNKLFWEAGRATVSRCAFALGACLQMTVVQHTEGMTIGFAWPRAAIEECLVDKTIEGIQAYFHSIA